MAKQQSFFIEEPRFEAYRSLIDSLAGYSDTVLLVAREQLKLSNEAERIFQRLLPFRQRQERASYWPGTHLLGHFALVSYYSVSSSVIDVLNTAVDSLYEWQQPKRPEDLCLLDSAGAPTLVTIAHEKEAWVTLPAEALERVRRAVGGRFFGEPR